MQNSSWLLHPNTPLGCLFAQIVFQQLDMHPIRGSWNNNQKRFLATASSDEPLKFLDFIEDAALAIPPACRCKLPRCLRVGTRADSDMFTKPQRVFLAGQMATPAPAPAPVPVPTTSTPTSTTTRPTRPTRTTARKTKQADDSLTIWCVFCESWTW